MYEENIMAIDLAFLDTYPDKVQNKIRTLIEEDGLEAYLNDLYPEKHKINTDKALFEYVQELRKKYMRKAPPAHKVVFDEKDETVYNALGDSENELILTDNGHKIKNVIRIASLYQKAPSELFHMVVVHELAHLKERDHSRNFYRLCHHMDGDYDLHEFDLRLYLISQGF
jgi:UTP pyrophosphatase